MLEIDISGFKKKVKQMTSRAITWFLLGVVIITVIMIQYV